MGRFGLGVALAVERDLDQLPRECDGIEPTCHRFELKCERRREPRSALHARGTASKLLAPIVESGVDHPVEDGSPGGFELSGAFDYDSEGVGNVGSESIWFDWD